ncbi:MAG TPA: hypothetical protein PKK06_18180 [Phycisphaerae bacterium]|nr:hypothetical protein [Phycisphaerae bacterium]
MCSWYRGTAVACIVIIGAGCSRKAPCNNEEIARYVYKWHDNEGNRRVKYSDPWIRYEVTSREGRRVVTDWITAHKEQLERGDKLGDIEPQDILAEECANRRGRWHPLALEVPEDPALPKGLRTWIPNLSEEDIRELRAIFMQYGVEVHEEARPLSATPRGYRYEWREDSTSLWTMYEVSSAEGTKAVAEWVATHRTHVLRARDLLGKVTPGDMLIELYPDGQCMHALLVGIPADASDLRNPQGVVPNLKQGDIVELRGIFRTQGVEHAYPPAGSDRAIAYYRCQWRDAPQGPWEVYDISAAEGIARVKQWMMAHRRQVERSEEEGRGDREPRLMLRELEVGGAAHTYYPKVGLAADTRLPKDEGPYVPNLSLSEILELEAIFREYGRTAPTPQGG